jgi:hypothetical protein
VRRIWALAQGHPWLTSALADQIVNRDVEDRGVPITALHVDSARETIILERRSHIDSLVARLREPRVRPIAIHETGRRYAGLRSPAGLTPMSPPARHTVASIVRATLEPATICMLGE